MHQLVMKEERVQEKLSCVIKDDYSLHRKRRRLFIKIERAQKNAIYQSRVEEEQRDFK